MNQVLEAIAQRRSIRKYKPQTPEEDQISVVVDAAFQAPSAKNRQSWHISVVKNKQILDEMSSLIRPAVEFEINGSLPAGWHLFHHAPVVMCLAVDNSNDWARTDVGIMAQNITLAAQSIGLGTCMIGFVRRVFDQAATGKELVPEARAILDKIGVPCDYDLSLCVCLGIADEKPDARPRSRNLTIVE